MRVLHIINTLRTGGAEKLLVDLLPRLKERGVDVELAVFDGTSTTFLTQIEDANICVHKLSVGNGSYNLRNLWYLKKLVRKRKYEILHSHNTSPQFFTALLKSLTSAKLITTEHSTSNRRRNKWYFRPIDCWMYHKYDRIICISNQAENLLRDHISGNPDKLLTIYNGIDVSRYHNALPMFVNKDGKFIVCMVAGFRYQKDHETAIRAISHLDKNKYILWLVGDGERRPIIEDLIRELGLEEIVKLLGIRNDVPSILRSVDVVLQSSHIEGFGLAAVEGMAAGKPVIASEVPGLAEVVRDAGVLFTHGDDLALAKEIEMLYNDRHYYDDVARRCYKRSSNYDINHVAEEYENIYNCLCNFSYKALN